MKIGIGIGATGLGILAIIVGGAMYAAKYHHTIGETGVALGIVLVIIGLAYWMMKEKPKPAAQAPQPAQTTTP